MKVLFINSCVRKESRTKQIAGADAIVIAAPDAGKIVSETIERI